MSGISRRDRAVVFIALLAAAVLVGMAVRSGTGGGAADLPREPLVVAAQTGVWLVFAADILVTAAIVDAIWYHRRLAKPGKPRHWTSTLALYLASMTPTILALIVLLYVRKPNGGGALFPMPGAGGFGAPRFGAASDFKASTTSAVDAWLGLVFAILIVIAFLAWLFWPAVNRRETRSRVPQIDAVVAVAVEESLEVLGSMTDPRQAIIAAYASMEASMSRAGWPRRASEAPVEFVTRILAAAAGMSGDLMRLTELFEVAKFSDHVVGERMRDDAIGALSGIRERLRVAAASTA
jgi:hypothetical protein